MKYEIWVYSIILVCALSVSYFISSGKKDSEGAKQIVLNLEKGEIDKIEYKIDQKYIVATKSANGKKFLIQIDDSKSKEKIRFISNKSFENILEKLSPFEADRYLGEISQVRLEDFGLLKSKEIIKIKKYSGEEFEYQVGRENFGTKKFFIRNSKTEVVYLVDRYIFRLFRNASKELIEKKLFGFDYEDVGSALISKGSQNKKLFHVKKNEKGQLIWTGDESGEDKKTRFGSWMDKLRKLKVVKYASEDVESELDKLSPIFNVEYSMNGELSSLQFAKYNKPSSPESIEFWVRSDYLSSWVLVPQNRMELIESEVDTLF